MSMVEDSGAQSESVDSLCSKMAQLRDKEKVYTVQKLVSLKGQLAIPLLVDSMDWSQRRFCVACCVAFKDMASKGIQDPKAQLLVKNALENTLRWKMLYPGTQKEFCMQDVAQVLGCLQIPEATDMLLVGVVGGLSEYRFACLNELVNNKSGLKYSEKQKKKLLGLMYRILKESMRFSLGDREYKQLLNIAAIGVAELGGIDALPILLERSGNGSVMVQEACRVAVGRLVG